MKVKMMLQLLLLILSVIHTGSGLPVTSKPIVNTPEHLAWEAWIMIPPTQNKTRKITPKSIFILPNKTTSPEINCPPGNVVENSKCIQTVQIDSNTILLNHFANVFNNTSYDTDYDYGEYEEPQTLVAETDNHASDFNDGPLKIDLLNRNSDKNETNASDDGIYYANDEKRTLNGYESSTNESPTTAKTTTASRISEVFFELTNKTTETIFTSTSIPPQSTNSKRLTSSLSTFAAVVSTAEVASNDSIATKIHASTSLPNETIMSAISTTLSSTASIQLTSTDPVVILSFNEDIVSDEEPGPEEQGAMEQSVPANGENLKEVKLPNGMVTKPEDYSVEGEYQNVTVVSFSADNDYMADEKLHGENLENQVATPPIAAPTTATISSPNFEPPIMVTTLPSTLLHTVHGKVSPAVNFSIVKRNDDARSRIDDEPLKTNGNSNNQNRLVYHHIETIDSTKKHETPVVDLQKQLRMINKAVEENKKRVELGWETVNPTDISVLMDNLRANFVQLSELPDQKGIVTTAPPTNLLSPLKNFPSLHKPTAQTSTVSLKTLPVPLMTTASDKQYLKPLWWRPSGWEVDKQGDKPLLLRFWSRASPNSSSSNPTTTGFRENSRRPTDNLYREISAQEFYNVVSARNGQYHNTHELT